MESIKQFFRICEFVAQEALSSIGRSGFMSWLVVMTMAVSLSILGGAWLMVQDLTDISLQMGGRVPIVAFLNDDADPKGVEAEIQQLPNVAQVDYISKDQAWSQMQMDMKTKMTMDNLLTTNPLPNSLRVQVKDSTQTDDTAASIQKLQGVEDISYGKDLLQKLAQFTAFIRTGGLAISGLLGLATLAVIMNTIRLAVMSRRREIEIMHLVGASNSFIAWPFLLEGMLLGFFGALLTGGVLVGWRYFMTDKWQQLFPFIQIQPDYFTVAQIFIAMAAVGMVIGALGSMLSVRKHIRLAMAD